MRPKQRTTKHVVGYSGLKGAAAVIWLKARIFNLETVVAG